MLLLGTFLFSTSPVMADKGTTIEYQIDTGDFAKTTANDFTIEWNKIVGGFHQTWEVTIQNLDDVITDRNFSLSFKVESGDVNDIDNVQLFELGNVSFIKRNFISGGIFTVCTPGKTANDTDTQSCVVIDNRTFEFVNSTKLVFEPIKTFTLSDTGDGKRKGSFGEIILPKLDSKEKVDKTQINGTKTYRVIFDLDLKPKTRGQFGFVDENSGVLYHPFWDEDWALKKEIRVNSNITVSGEYLFVLENISTTGNFNSDCSDFRNINGTETVDRPHVMDNGCRTDLTDVLIRGNFSSQEYENLLYGFLYYNNSGVTNRSIDDLFNDTEMVWHFFEGNETNIANRSNVEPTLSGSGTNFVAGGRYGQAYSCDTSSARFLIYSDPGWTVPNNEGFSVGGWFRLDAKPDWAGLFDLGRTNAEAWSFWTSSTDIIEFTTTNPTANTITHTISADSSLWWFFTATYDRAGDTMMFFTANNTPGALPNVTIITIENDVADNQAFNRMEFCRNSGLGARIPDMLLDNIFVFTYPISETQAYILWNSSTNLGAEQDQSVVPFFTSNNTFQGDVLENDNSVTYMEKNISFGINVTDDDGDTDIINVIFETDFTGTLINHSITSGTPRVENSSIGGEYNITFTPQSGGDYQISWFAEESSETNLTRLGTFSISANSTSTNFFTSASINGSYINFNQTLQIDVNVSSNETMDAVLIEIELTNGTSNYTLQGTQANFTLLLNDTNLGIHDLNATQVNITNIYFNNSGTNYTSNTNVTPVSINFGYATASISSVTDTPDPVSNSSGQTFTATAVYNDGESGIITSGCNFEIFSINNSMNFNSALNRFDVIISSEQLTGLYPYRVICDGNTSYQSVVDSSGEITLSSGGGGVGGGNGGGGGGGVPTEITTSVNISLGRNIFASPGQQRLIEIDIVNDKESARTIRFSSAGTFKDWARLDTIDEVEVFRNDFEIPAESQVKAGILITVPEDVADANYIILLNFENLEDKTTQQITLEVIVASPFGFGSETIDFITQKFLYSLKFQTSCEGFIDRGICIEGANEFDIPIGGFAVVGAFTLTLFGLRRYSKFFKQSTIATIGVSLVPTITVLLLIP